MVHGVRLEDLVLCKVTPRVSDSGLNHLDAFTGAVTDGLVPCTPERQKNVTRAFAGVDFPNGIFVKLFVRVVIQIKLEQLRLEIVIAVRTVVILAAQDGDVFGTLNVRILVTVVNDGVSSKGHHRTKLEHLLGECTRDIIFRRHGVLNAEGVKSHTCKCVFFLIRQ